VRDEPDRPHHLVGSAALEQEATGPGAQRGVHVLVVLERGDHDDPGWIDGHLHNGPGGLDPVHVGHPDVHQDDVRAQPADQREHLGGRCGRLNVTVGIDDDRNDARQTGSATFEIWADGVKVADSGLRTWADDPLPLTADLTGARYLRLVLTDGGNTNSYDRGDWAEPKLTCQ
jgi:hypothetical protein